MLVRGVFVFSELAPAHPPLAFAVTPPGGLNYVLRTIAMGPGGFCFQRLAWLGGFLQRDDEAQGIVEKGVWSILHNTGKWGVEFTGR